MVMNGLLTALSGVELIFAIACAACCCKAICRHGCCCENIDERRPQVRALQILRRRAQLHGSTIRHT